MAMCNMCTCTIQNVYRNKRGKVKGAKGADGLMKGISVVCTMVHMRTYRAKGRGG